METYDPKCVTANVQKKGQTKSQDLYRTELFIALQYYNKPLHHTLRINLINLSKNLSYSLCLTSKKNGVGSQRIKND